MNQRNQTPRIFFDPADSLTKGNNHAEEPLVCFFFFLLMLAMVTIATGLLVAPIFPVTLRWIACIPWALSMTNVD
ncbi:hypothetical protein S7335_1167 [Synechococcus sp. PCC 7335]|uniref:hypothetical protein n=1 Tax=Synechococcus sp. (strain ATCC 29403 / PCC 7335) TaxID=91464 RepID=UPI00017EB924|nr:hypothetical protein [Synechococcus sp. PCC 7335]EDX82463.1 hypothetical protein S7335_1167 [Synechococcus sp. PCC 7335]